MIIQSARLLKVNCSACSAAQARSCVPRRPVGLRLTQDLKLISSALVAPLAPAVEAVLCAQPLAPPAGRLVRARVRVRVRVRVKG